MGKAIRRQTAFSIHCLERHWAACVVVPIPGKTLCGLFSREFNCGWEVDSEKGRLSPAQGASEPASLNKQKCFKINFVFVLPKPFKINSVFVLERERENMHVLTHVSTHAHVELENTFWTPCFFYSVDPGVPAQGRHACR